jgi:hypothetical protein
MLRFTNDYMYTQYFTWKLALIGVKGATPDVGLESRSTLLRLSEEGAGFAAAELLKSPNSLLQQKKTKF